MKSSTLRDVFNDLFEKHGYTFLNQSMRKMEEDILEFSVQSLKSHHQAKIICCKNPKYKPGTLSIHGLCNWMWLHHPNILHLIEYFTDDHYVYYVCDTFATENILSHLEHQGITTGHAREALCQKWTKECLMALKHLHDLHLYHCNFSWDSVLLDNNDDVKLFKFEFLRFMTPSTKVHLWSNIKCRCPEGLEERKLTPHEVNKAEVWALGAGLLSLLLKLNIADEQFQIPSTRASEKQIYNNIKKNTAVLPLHLKQSDLSEDGKEFVIQVLSFKPDTRPTVEEALEHPWLHTIAKHFPKKFTHPTLTTQITMPKVKEPHKTEDMSVPTVVHQSSTQEEKDAGVGISAELCNEVTNKTQHTVKVPSRIILESPMLFTVDNYIKKHPSGFKENELEKNVSEDSHRSNCDYLTCEQESVVPPSDRTSAMTDADFATEEMVPSETPSQILPLAQEMTDEQIQKHFDCTSSPLIKSGFQENQLEKNVSDDSQGSYCTYLTCEQESVVPPSETSLMIDADFAKEEMIPSGTPSQILPLTQGMPDEQIQNQSDCTSSSRRETNEPQIAIPNKCKQITNNPNEILCECFNELHEVQEEKEDAKCKSEETVLNYDIDRPLDETVTLTEGVKARSVEKVSSKMALKQESAIEMQSGSSHESKATAGIQTDKDRGSLPTMQTDKNDETQKSKCKTILRSLTKMGKHLKRNRLKIFQWKPTPEVEVSVAIECSQQSVHSSKLHESPKQHQKVSSSRAAGNSNPPNDINCTDVQTATACVSYGEHSVSTFTVNLNEQCSKTSATATSEMAPSAASSGLPRQNLSPFK